MKIISTNTAIPTTFNWNGKEETTGIYKKPTNKPIYLTENDVKGDEGGTSVQIDFSEI